jgi:hypothetical protein
MVGGCLGTLVSSTTKTGRHDIAEILLKHQKVGHAPKWYSGVGCIPIGSVVILVMGHYYKFLSKHSSNLQHRLVKDNPIKVL